MRGSGTGPNMCDSGVLAEKGGDWDSFSSDEMRKSSVPSNARQCEVRATKVLPGGGGGHN